MTDEDYRWKLIEGSYPEHEREYGTAPKAIALVSFFRQIPLREMVSQTSKVMSNLAKWSSSYEEDGQICFWIFDREGSPQ